jgi:hypothetical protein
MTSKWRGNSRATLKIYGLLLINSPLGRVVKHSNDALPTSTRLRQCTSGSHRQTCGRQSEESGVTDTPDPPIPAQTPDRSGRATSRDILIDRFDHPRDEVAPADHFSALLLIEIDPDAAVAGLAGGKNGAGVTLPGTKLSANAYTKSLQTLRLGPVSRRLYHAAAAATEHHR